MKSTFLHKICFIGILIISSFSYAQSLDNAEEDKLKFQEYFFEALKQKAIRNYSNAIENLEKCYGIDSTNVAVQFEFSKNYLALQKYFEAEQFINIALEKEPENFYLLQHKVAIYKVQQNFNNAITIQKEIVKKQPKYSDELVLLYLQNQNFEEAEKLIIELEENALTTLRIKEFKNYLESRKNPSEIVSAQVIFKNEDIESLRTAFKEKKEYKLVQEILKREAKSELFEMMYLDSKNALELFPSQPYLYKMNGLALNKLGKYNEAITVLTIGIDFVVDDKTMEADFYEQLFTSYKELGNPKEATKFKLKAADLRKEI